MRLFLLLCIRLCAYLYIIKKFFALIRRYAISLILRLSKFSLNNTQSNPILSVFDFIVKALFFILRKIKRFYFFIDVSPQVVAIKDIFYQPQKKKKLLIRGDKKILFISGSTSNYDKPIDPKFIYEDADYFYFTDQEKIQSNVWKPFWAPYYNFDKQLSARFIKWKMIKFFESYDCVIWQDSNILQTEDISSIIRFFFNYKQDLMLFKHPCRDTVAQELSACLIQNKINKDQYNKFIKNKESFLNFNGLVETGFMIINPKSKKLESLMEKVFNDMRRLSIYRDQLFIPRELQSYKIKYSYINNKDRSLSVRDYGHWILLPHRIGNLYNLLNKNKNNLIIKKTKPLPSIKPSLKSFSQKTTTLLLPVYNAEKYVMKCIKSILPQLSKSINLIVVDDCSKLPFSKKLELYLNDKKFIKYYRNDKNSGYVKTVNRSVKSFVNTDSFFVINSDTEYPNDFFDTLKSILFSDASYGAVVSLGLNAGIFNIGKQDFNHFINQNDLDVNCNNYLHFPNDLHGACYGVKTDLAREIEFLDERYFPIGYGEENDFYLRMLEKNKDVVLSLGTHFIHHKNKSFGAKNRNIYKLNGINSLRAKHGEKVISNFIYNAKLSEDYLSMITKK